MSTTPNLKESMEAMQPALSAEHFEAAPAKIEEVQVVDINTIHESGDNDRINYSNIEQLAESIKQQGMLQPITVRIVADHKVVVFGHRRLRAAKMAELEQVPVRVTDMTDVQVYEARIAENAQRVGLNAMEEAAAYRRLQEASGYSVEQIAAKVGSSRATVYGRLKLFDLTPELQKVLAAGQMDTSIAIPLARISNPKLQLSAWEKISTPHQYSREVMSTRDAIDWLKKDFTISLEKAPFDTKDDMLIQDAGACTKCPKRSGGRPGLFDDLDNAKTCTDVPCYRLKVAAAWDAKAEKLTKQGATVLSIAEGQKLFKTGNLPYSSKYVEADKPAPGDREKNRTWSQLVDKAKDAEVEVIIAPDADMQPRRMFLQKEALEALKDDHKWAKAEIKKSATKSTTNNAEQSQGNYELERKKREARDQVVIEVLKAIAPKVKAEGFTLPAMRIIAGEFEAFGDIATILGAEGSVEKWIETKADKEKLLTFSFLAALQRLAGNTWNGIDPELVKVATKYNVDVKQLERDALEPLKAELAESKEKKKAK